MEFLNKNSQDGNDRSGRLMHNNQQGNGFAGGIVNNSGSSSSAPPTTSGSGDDRQAKINLPVGGGAIRGIGEKFQANPATGTASFTVPLCISEGRAGFTPQLELGYDSGSGNSAFGLGWNIGLPSITRKTDKGLPQYIDNPQNESDTFILSGAEDLVPTMDGDERQCRTEGNYDIYGYRPRIEGLFAKIERWVDKTTRKSHWRTISRENIVSVFGFSAQARITDPEHDHRIFSWLLEESWDAKGNLMRFAYKQEDSENIEKTCYERHRFTQISPSGGVRGCANRYLKQVSYGNTTMCAPSQAGLSNYDNGFLFNLVFDYGEHADNQLIPSQAWLARPDAFSSYKARFEIRTYRLCRRVLMFHSFAELGNLPVLVHSTDLEYDSNSSFSLLKSVTQCGYDASTGVAVPKPPVDFGYTQATPASYFKEVDESMLRQLPAGVDGQNYQWADLYSEGVSGILTMNNNHWYFKPNYGDKQFRDENADHAPTFGAMQSEVPRPAAANNNKTATRLSDIDNDGLPEFVVQGEGMNGYYARDANGKWQNFRSFEKIPNINTNDPNLRYMDLTGDGTADMVISKGETFDIYFSEGKKGFGNYRRVHCGTEHGSAPKALFSDYNQTIFLADMSGDGLTDIVKITNQGIVYWPNIGYGQFGEKVIMSNPPLLDSSDQFNARFVHLADVDGTGTADLLYISKRKVRYFKNLSGNAWEEQELPGTISVTATQQTYIQITDLLGNGTQCVVVSSSLPAQSKKMRYWELTSGIKPFLLNEIKNNMGSITQLHYAPSTKFYVQDKFKGTPWITKLPFPVHVLEKVEIIDLVGEKRFTNRYAYHHGYYDAMEKEFRGFGMVEQWDCENYESGIMNYELAGETVYTKSWFHTGYNRLGDSYRKEYWNEDEQAWELKKTKIPQGLGAEEYFEAYRALKGVPLRVEVHYIPKIVMERDSTLPGAIYEQAVLDSSTLIDPNQPIFDPIDMEMEQCDIYTIEEKNYNLQCLQPKGKNKHAVFLKTDGETLMYNYELKRNDPRILHKLVLETDNYGNETKTAEIAYPKRTPRVRRLDLLNFTPTKIEQTKTLITYSEAEFINDTDEKNLIGIPYYNRQFEIHNLDCANNKFEAENLLAEIEQCAEIDYATEPCTTNKQKRLIQESKNIFWNENCTQPLPLGEVAPQTLMWQKHSLELTQELITYCNGDDIKLTTDLLANNCKYLQDGDNWYAISETEHFMPDNFYLPDTTTDQFGKQTNITYDSYNLFPVKITDALGFETFAEHNYQTLQPHTIIDPNGNSQQVQFDNLGMVTKLAVAGKYNEGDTLDNPTEIYEYDLHCWKNAQKPVFVHIKKRETHQDNNTRWLETRVYTDGLGNEILTKTKAENGNAWIISQLGGRLSISRQPMQVHTDNRWLASGKVIYNNKGLPIKQYEPWFSNTHEFTFEEELTHYGVTPIMHYDALGRLIKTDFPDKTTTKVEFDAWQQKIYDQNDCDENSPHYNTPQIIDLDVLGRPFQITDDNGSFGDSCITHNKLDITGRILIVKDGLSRVATATIYALSEEHILAVYNIDSGIRWTIADTAGKPTAKWDGKENEFFYHYDELQRLTDTVVNGACTERLVYGTLAAQNDIGQIIETYAQDGLKCLEYDFKGNIIRQLHLFTENFQTQPDWNADVDFEGEKYTSETVFDALNRPVDIYNDQEVHIHYEYDKGGLLQKVACVSEHITNIEYNEKGQRLNVYYDNNTKTKYEYNPLNFRLTRILTTRNNGQDILQDLNYEYDAVGNITMQTDNAQQTHYFDNKVVAPTSIYKYDSLYRLIKAKGRELTSLTAPTHEDFDNDIYCPNPAANAMQNYTHIFQYDALGNMLEDAWKTNEYDTETNRLLGHNGTTNQYTYDEHGNMLTMPHLSSMVWDEKDQLVSAGNGTFTSYYNYDAQGNRTRKVTEKGNIIETRYYINGYEIFRKEENGSLETERITLNVSDDEKVFVRVEYVPGEEYVVRYQYDNHLGSACLELDEAGDIISYEEYHPFGTTSYRSGRSDVEVSLKRYKYCGKERDEETGLYYYGARYYAAWLCRFVSVDPLKEKYPNISTYVYCANNPLKYIDPDGREVVISGALKDEALKQLQERMNESVTLSMTESGNLGYSINQGVEKLQGEALMLAGIIDDASITVNLITTDKNETSTGNLMVGGAFMGNIVTTDANGNVKVVANQEVNPNVLGLMSQTNLSPGMDMMHETTEAYQGAKISKESGVSSPASNQSGSVYQQAHNRAIPQSGRVYETVYGIDGKEVHRTDPSASRVTYSTSPFLPSYGTQRPRGLVIIVTYP